VLNRAGQAGLVAILGGLLPGLALAQKPPLTIGIVTGQLQNPNPDSFAPFTAWLNARVPGESFRIRQLATIEDLLQAVERRQIDFAFTTPVAMVELNVRYGARPIATVMQPVESGQNYPWLAGAVFTKNSRTEIQTMNDVRGKRVVALSPLALGGWLSVVREWRKAGIREDTDLGNLRFVFSYAKVVDEVCQDRADIGILGANALMTATARCPEKLRVLPANGGGRDPRYPVEVSTQLYPEEAFAVTREENEAVVAQVTTALLAIEPDSDVAKAATVAAFTAPLSYEPVQQLMQDLRLRPFESYGRLTFRQAVEQYGIWIVGILTGFLVVLTWSLMRARRLNARLGESEYFRRRVFEGSHLPIVVMDEQTQTYIDCNPAAAAIYGFGSREETLGKTPADVSAPFQPDGGASEPGGRRYMDRAIAEGSVVFEWRHQRPNGELWDAEVHLMSFRSGQRQLFQFTLEDITERRKTEQMRNTLASVLEASHDFIGIATMQGEVTYLNHGAKVLVGMEESRPSQLRLQDLFASKDQEHFAGAVMPALLRDGWVRSESNLRHFQSGKPIPVEMEGIVIRDVRGTAICMATVMRDLSERYEAARQRERLETRLVQAQKMEALGRLTGGIAHDFNNSLTVILGYAALLGSSDQLSEKQRKGLKGIREAGEHSRDMVGQLLGFSRQQIIAPRPLDLNQWIAQSRQILQRLVGEDVELDVFPGMDLWNVMLDTTQVYQVLMNLVANARDAMPSGGKLTIETSNFIVDENFAQTDPSARPGEYVMLAVGDTGIGMDSATAAQVFEPFFTTKPEGQGTGLGLATVYGIVRQNHGFIHVYSEPGIGATFKICFPRLARDAGDSGAGKAVVTPATAGRKGSILLVEDDELVRDMTADTLTWLGYTPLVAAGAREALGICANRATPVDLMITDVVMPEMKGTELRDRLVEMRPGLKVLFVSGYTSNVIVRHGVLKPGVDFLQKPFSVEGLSEKIERILGNQARNEA
jgi:PAS domain S-box-containing protein